VLSFRTSSEVNGKSLPFGACLVRTTSILTVAGTAYDKARGYVTPLPPHPHQPMINSCANIPTMSLTLYIASHFWSVLLHLHRSVFRLSLALFCCGLFVLSSSLYVWSLLLKQMAVRNEAKLLRKTVIFHVAWNSEAGVYMQHNLIKAYIVAF
jgi:hypothetical protein